MDEATKVAFDLIAHAGAAKSEALEAIDLAVEGNFAEAEEKIARGREEMIEAHDAHFGLIQKEAGGDHVDVTIMLVHALDHLTMAIMSLDMAERFVSVLKK